MGNTRSSIKVDVRQSGRTRFSLCCTGLDFATATVASLKRSITQDLGQPLSWGRGVSQSRLTFAGLDITLEGDATLASVGLGKTRQSTLILTIPPASAFPQYGPLDPEERMWALAKKRFAEAPPSNGSDARYAAVKTELRQCFGAAAINVENKSRLKRLARDRGVENNSVDSQLDSRGVPPAPPASLLSRQVSTNSLEHPLPTYENTRVEVAMLPSARGGGGAGAAGGARADAVGPAALDAEAISAVLARMPALPEDAGGELAAADAEAAALAALGEPTVLTTGNDGAVGKTGGQGASSGTEQGGTEPPSTEGAQQGSTTALLRRAEPPAVGVEQGVQLRVLRSSPSGALGAGATEVHVSFSQPMVELSALEDDIAHPPCRLEPAVEGRWQWLSTAQLKFETTAAAGFPLATSFTATVPAGTTSVLGHRLEQAESWEFSTAPAKLVRSIPFDGCSTGMGPMPLVTLYFDQPVDAASLAGLLRLVVQPAEGPSKVVGAGCCLMGSAEGVRKAKVNGDGVVQAAEEKKKRGDLKAFFVWPEARLPGDSAVRVDIAEGLRSLAGPLPAKVGSPLPACLLVCLPWIPRSATLPSVAASRCVH